MTRVADAEATPDSPTIFAPLKNPVFRPIWLATQVSNLGWLMQNVAISWLMATIVSSDLMVALVQASSTLPAFLLSIFAGAIADNFNRRKIMLAARWLMVVASTALALLVAMGHLNPWVILGFSFLIGCGSALNNPAWQSSVADIVVRRELPSAIMLISVGFNTIRSVGPALGGLVVASLGPLTALAFGAASFLAPIAAVWRCNWNVRSTSLPREAMGTAIRDGVRFTAMSSEIKAAIARGTLFGLASISILALLPVVVRDQMTAGPLVYGVLMAGFGTGAFLAGISAGFLRRMLSPELLLRIACIACAICCTALAISPQPTVAAVALALGGGGWVIAWSGLGACVQLASPRWIAGRTLSIYYALTYGGIAAGSWLWGVLAEHYSLPLALEASAGALVLAALAGLRLPVSERSESDDPLEAFEVPPVALDLQPRSGPIVVKVEYRIAEHHVEAFLGLMRERRRAQSRVGARHWTLQRNLQKPEEWTESFSTPTWTDYLRLNHRLTTPDLDLEDRVRQLSSNEDWPRLVLLIERPPAASRKHARTAPLFPHH